MDKKHFMKNLFYIILYGVFGSFLNFIFVGLLTWAYYYIMIIYFNQKLDDQPYHQTITFNILVYSVIISSKDSNVIRSILKFSEHPKLSSILFGECIYLL